MAVSGKESHFRRGSFGLLEGTEVLTPRGKVSVETLKVGDEVVCFSSDNCCIRGFVQQIEDAPISRFKEIVFADQVGSVFCAPGQCLLNGSRWVAAEDVREGDNFDSLEVERVDSQKFPNKRAYAFSVNPHGNFVVQTNMGFIVVCRGSSLSG